MFIYFHYLLVFSYSSSFLLSFVHVEHAFWTLRTNVEPTDHTVLSDMHFIIMLQYLCLSVQYMFNEMSKRMCTVIIVNFYLRIESTETYVLGSVTPEVYHWGQSRAWVTWCQAVNSEDYQTPDWWSRPRHWFHSNTVSPFINGGVRNHVCSDNFTMQESNSDICIIFVFYICAVFVSLKHGVSKRCLLLYTRLNRSSGLFSRLREIFILCSHFCYCSKLLCSHVYVFFRHEDRNLSQCRNQNPGKLLD